MIKAPFSNILCSLVVLLLISIISSQTTSDSILIYDVKSLTFYKNQWTTGKRTSPIPQLTRIGGSAPSTYTPDVVQCVNQGTNDMGNVQWKCSALMPNKYNFGRIAVSCEGYTSSNDKVILKGSCGLKYELNENPFSNLPIFFAATGGAVVDEARAIATFFGLALIIGVVLCLLMCLCGVCGCCSTPSQTYYDPVTKTYTTVETMPSIAPIPIVASAPVFVPSFPYPSYGYSSTTIVSGGEDPNALSVHSGFGGTEFRGDNGGGGFGGFFGGSDGGGDFESR